MFVMHPLPILVTLFLRSRLACVINALIDRQNGFQLNLQAQERRNLKTRSTRIVFSLFNIKTFLLMFEFQLTRGEIQVNTVQYC